MIILEEPYISEMLLSFLEEMQIPVLKNECAKKVFTHHQKLNLYEEKEFVEEFRSDANHCLYTVSEYALDRVYKSMPDDELTEKVLLLKNKAAFRNACSTLFKDFYYKEVPFADLFDFNVGDIPLPVVLKPSVGFLSAGVYTINSSADWTQAVSDIHRNFRNRSALFPDKVVEDANFIVESYISGREFAIDLYFKDYEPVIINIFEHLFSSATDVSDRVYVTNKGLFDRYLCDFRQHVKTLNEVLKLNNMPVHIEIRVEGDKIIPIEINPLRFAGLCLNELHYHIAGQHPLYYLFTRTVPDYEAMWKGKELKNYSFSVFEKPESMGAQQFLDMNKIQELFSNILELRTVDNPNLNIAAFVFSETDSSGNEENENILKLEMEQLIN